MCFQLVPSYSDGLNNSTLSANSKSKLKVIYSKANSSGQRNILASQVTFTQNV